MLGVTALIITYVVGFAVARGLRHRSCDRSMRGQGQAVAASIAAFGISAAAFEELSFRQAAFTLFLLLGCAGALWSTVQDNPSVAGPEGVKPRSQRKWRWPRERSCSRSAGPRLCGICFGLSDVG